MLSKLKLHYTRAVAVDRAFAACSRRDVWPRKGRDDSNNKKQWSCSYSNDGRHEHAEYRIEAARCQLPAQFLLDIRAGLPIWIQDQTQKYVDLDPSAQHSYIALVL